MPNDSEGRFVPSPVGTVRGPYTCGFAGRHDGGEQYLVQGHNGWVPVIDVKGGGARGKADAYAAEVLAGKHPKRDDD